MDTITKSQGAIIKQVQWARYGSRRLEHVCVDHGCLKADLWSGGYAGAAQLAADSRTPFSGRRGVSPKRPVR